MTDSFAERLARALDARDVKKDSLFIRHVVRSARKFYLVLPNFYPSPQIN